MKSHNEPLVPGELTATLVETYSTLGDAFHGLRNIPLPSAAEVAMVIERLREVLFPGIANGFRPAAADLRPFVEATLHEVAFSLRKQICLAQRYMHRHARPNAECVECDSCADQVTRGFLADLPAIRKALTLDAEAAMAGDPAARDLGEVILSYPGHYAITAQRIAHSLWVRGAPLVPRMITEHAHHFTGIDIHPGATIGERFFIDHGTGVVVGETTMIGNRVRLYQGVTLGALSLSSKKVKELRAGPKRHPTLEDDVIVYSGATILGGETVIGRGTIVGGNCWIVESVPPHSRVTVQVASAVRQAGNVRSQPPTADSAETAAEPRNPPSLLSGSFPEALDWVI
ncbi:MAG: serine acetyltransferase [Deltaproteobacteria bacterium]|nr:serine acetyltransferase [Deltaproteobacteria bacterium]